MRPAQDTAATVIEWLREERRVAAGLLVGVDGSAPLDVGASMYVDADGTIEGSVTGGCVESAVVQEAIALMEGDGTPRLVTYGISDELAGTVGLTCGATDFSAALARIAGGVGYQVTIADPRTAFLSSARFSSSAETVSAWPDKVLDDVTLGPRDAVLVFAHDPKLDEPALMAAFATDARYIGALRSRKTTADRAQRLHDAGASDADLARLYAPCGLDIGAATV